MERNRPLLDWVLAQTQRISVLCLIGISSLLFVQLLLRNIFSIGYAWIDELARFFHICMVFLAVPLLYKEDGMLKVDFFVERLPISWIRIINTTVTLICLIFAASFLYSEISFMRNAGNIITPALRMPNTFFFCGALIGMFLTAIVLLEKLVKNFRKGRD